MPGLIRRILGIVLVLTTLFLNGCNFGADNAGDIYGSSQPSQNSNEHSIPESQKTGTVTGDAGPQTSRY
jgi:hypothetical protein